MVDPAEPPVDDASRRRFVALMGGGAAAASLSVLLGACGGVDDANVAKEGDTGSGSASEPRAATKDDENPKGDLEIVAYALMLEQVENAFYRKVVSSGEVKTRGPRELIKSIQDNEVEHLDALTATVKKLGGRPGEAKAMSFDKVIEGGEGRILRTSATLENLGTSAYLGQAARISSREVLAAALSIHTVEARHAAALNKLVGRGFTGPGSLSGSAPDGAFALPRSRPKVLRQVEKVFG